MNQKVVFAFVVIAVSAVLARPPYGRDDIVPPVASTLPPADAPPVPGIPSSSIAPEIPSSSVAADVPSSSVAPPVPEVPVDVPTIGTLSDDATAEPVTLPATVGEDQVKVIQAEPVVPAAAQPVS